MIVDNIMDEETNDQTVRSAINKLTSKPLHSDVDHKSNNICYALLKNNFCIVDCGRGKTIYESPQVHEGRIGCIRSK